MTYDFTTGTHIIRLEVSDAGDPIRVRIALTNAFGNQTSDWVPPGQSTFYRDKTMALEECIRQLLADAERRHGGWKTVGDYHA